MNKREMMLGLAEGSAETNYVPAAFFLHFDPAFHQGQAAIDKHLEFFRATDMDFVKIQYEQTPPPEFRIRKVADWARIPLYPDDYFEPPIEIVEGLVKAAKRDALIIMTLYSPLMWAERLMEDASVADHLTQDPAAVQLGLATLTENVLKLVRGCKRVGADGFYVSTQGGEAFRFPGTDHFSRYIKPTDLAVWRELQDCAFNILHVCDYHGSYDDLTPFLDYPGHVVNSSLHIGNRTLTTQQAATMFGRPFMGGLERKAEIAIGSQEAIIEAAQEVLDDAPGRFILAADCTVPAATPWANLRAAVDTAHRCRR
jgi:uroporphyrinogen decarboxylase